MDVLDRKLQILEEKDHFASIERTRGAVDRLLPTIRAAKDPALRDIYVSKVSERTGVRRETLEAELEKKTPGIFSSSRSRPGPRAPSVGIQRTVYMGAERKLLLLLIQFRDFVDLAAKRLGPDEFLDPDFRAIFEALVENPELTRPPSEMGPSAASRLEELLGDPEMLPEASRVFEDSIGQIKEGQLGLRAEALRAKMSTETDPTRQEDLVRELQEIARLRRELKTDWRPAIRQRQSHFDPTQLS